MQPCSRNKESGTGTTAIWLFAIYIMNIVQTLLVLPHGGYWILYLLSTCIHTQTPAFLRTLYSQYLRSTAHLCKVHARNVLAMNGLISRTTHTRCLPRLTMICIKLSAHFPLFCHLCILPQLTFTLRTTYHQWLQFYVNVFAIILWGFLNFIPTRIAFRV